MKKKAMVLMVVLLFLTSCKLDDTIEPYDVLEVVVEEVVDGDTIKVKIDGKKESIRFIGVNTPEVEREDQMGEYYGEEASAFSKELLYGKTVYLTKDRSNRDRYGRLLRFVWIEKPSNPSNEEEIRAKMFNATLLLEGYAQTVKFEPDTTHYDLFVSFQDEAKANDRGMWAPIERKGDVVISIFDKNAELVVLKNVSEYAVELTGYSLISVKDPDTQKYIFDNWILEPEETVRLYCGPKTTDYEYDILWSEKYIFSNSKEDPIALINPQGQIIDQVTR